MEGGKVECGRNKNGDNYLREHVFEVKACKKGYVINIFLRSLFNRR